MNERFTTKKVATNILYEHILFQTFLFESKITNIVFETLSKGIYDYPKVFMLTQRYL